jgi:YVTN family beta-propeller protein
MIVAHPLSSALGRAPTTSLSRWRVAALAASLMAGWACAGAAESIPPLTLRPVADIPLGGRSTRLDYASVDAARHLLFIAHLGDSEVIAFDTAAQRVVARISDVSHVHGMLVIPELNRVYASATGTNEVVAIDEATYKITARMPGGVYPDGMAYAPDVHKLYVSDEHGGTDTVIDVRTNTAIATIRIGGDIGNTQYDPDTRHIFVNAQTKGELVEIDPSTDAVVRRIPLPGAKENHGLLIDSAQHRAFIACEGNDRLIVLDLPTGKVLTSFNVAKDPDVLALDPSRHELYVAGESGQITAFKLATDTVEKTAESFLATNAHVVAVDPTTHQVYFPLKDVNGKTVLRIMSPAP